MYIIDNLLQQQQQQKLQREASSYREHTHMLYDNDDIMTGKMVRGVQ